MLPGTRADGQLADGDVTEVVETSGNYELRITINDAETGQKVGKLFHPWDFIGRAGICRDLP